MMIKINLKTTVTMIIITVISFAVIIKTLMTENNLVSTKNWQFSNKNNTDNAIQGSDVKSTELISSVYKMSVVYLISPFLSTSVIHHFNDTSLLILFRLFIHSISVIFIFQSVLDAKHWFEPRAQNVSHK